MKAQNVLLVLIIVGAMTATSSAAPPASPPRVTEVIVLDVGANMSKFVDLSSRVDAIAAKYQSTGQARYWISAWAGSETGHVIVTIEYPSLVSMAQSVAKINASPEFAKWMTEAQASGIKQLSESVAIELPRR
jgi:hypothetical protein